MPPHSVDGVLTVRCANSVTTQNYNGLDRYNREGVRFQFDRIAKKFTYDGAAWREILKRYPNGLEAVEARKHLEALNNVRAK